MTYPLVINMAMENPPFMDDFPIETSIYMGFPIAMFDYQRVNGFYENVNGCCMAMFVNILYDTQVWLH